MITSESALLGVLGLHKFDAIVVEGYDGVGKGRVLDKLSRLLGVTPYRPDYNLWQKHDIRKTDRWKMSGFFWDIFSHFGYHTGTMLFDRGCISGAVYANDPSIADDYKKLLRDMKVLHILVDCSHDDYLKFLKCRNPDMSDEEMYDALREKVVYTQRYEEYLYRAEVNWIVYQNKFDEVEANRLASTCAGCGHYSYGTCRHPSKNLPVDAGFPRCSLSYDKETQDMEVETSGAEMQCV